MLFRRTDPRASYLCRLTFTLMALAVAMPLLSYPFSSRAASTRQLSHLLATNPPNGEFGRSMARSGDTLVIGEPHAWAGSSSAGVASVFVRAAGEWQLQAKLQAPDGAYNDRFGTAVAISGDTIAISAPLRNGPNSVFYMGKVYIFTRSGSTWSLQSELIEEVPAYHSFFGQALALEGETLLIGADMVGPGTAYLYTRSPGGWQREAQFRPSTAMNQSGFGRAMALRGGTLVVGAPGEGAAYLFELQPGGWQLQQRLTSDESATLLSFGWAVALNEQELLIGAPSINNEARGAAYLYRRSGDQWLLQSMLSASDDTKQLSYGTAVALSNDTLVIGAPNHHLEGYDVPNLQSVGAAYLYQRSGDSWPLAAFLSGSADKQTEAFGATAIISGQEILISAPRTGGAIGSADGIVYSAGQDSLSRAADDQAATPEEVPLTLAVLENDTPGAAGSLSPGYLDLTLLHRPRHGTALVDLSAGTITYTPTKNFNGDDTFTYVAGWGLPATVTVTVSPIFEPPLITSSPPTKAVEQLPYTYRITTADPDPEELRISALALPGWLSLIDNGDGTAVLTGTAGLADIGDVPIQLIVTDPANLQATQSFTINVQPYLPSAPTNLIAEAISRSEMRLSWSDNSSNEQSFAIDRQTAGGPWQRVAVVGAGKVSFTDQQRTCNTLYSYRVSALNAQGASPPSVVAEALIADCSINAPADLQAITLSAASLGLEWSDQSDNESGFSIERSPNGCRSARRRRISQATASSRSAAPAFFIACGPLTQGRAQSPAQACAAVSARQRPRLICMWWPWPRPSLAWNGPT
jgi:FG-GAP repeat/Bacterial Ig domain/Fibronectin type III domain